MDHNNSDNESRYRLRHHDHRRKKNGVYFGLY